MAKVLCKPHWEKTGQSKSVRIGQYSKFQKHIHDGSVSRSWPIMDMLLKFGIGADSSTFGQPVVPSDFCLCASIHAVKRFAFEKVSFIYAEFRNQTQSGTFSKIKVKIMKL